MPQPTQSESHVDAVLSNISVAYIQKQEHFIASKVFPIVPVSKQTDKYYVYTKNDWFRDEAERRADATESAGSGYNLSTTSYVCDVFALHKDVGDQVVKNSDSVLQPFASATEFITQKLLLRQEIQWVTDAFTDSIWATDKTGVTDFPVWSDYTSSDPIDDVEAGKETILQSTGFMPNVLVLGYQVFRKLKHHPDILDRIKYTTAAVVTEQLLATMFGVEKILVALSIKATNIEAGTAAYAFTHGKHALLAYVNPAPAMLTPSAGYTFAWQGISQGIGSSTVISRFRMEKLKADRVEGEKAWDNKIVSTDLGYFFSGAVA